MRILLFGAGGFIGGAAARALLGGGHDVVAALSPPASPERHPHLSDTLDRLEVHRVDPRRPSSLIELAEGADAIVGARRFSPNRRASVAESLPSALTHVQGLLEAARKSRARRLVFIGCASTAGRVEGREATEQDAALPGLASGPYVDVSYAMESEVLAANSASLFTTVLMPSLVVGPGDPRPPEQSLVRGLMEGRHKVLIHAEVNVVDVRDVARSIHNAVQQGRPGQRYLLGGRTTTVADIAGHLHRHHGAPMPHLTQARLVGPAAGARALERVRLGSVGPLVAPIYQSSPHLDRTKAKVELGHVSRKVEATLDEAARWIAERPSPAIPPR